MTAAEHQRNGRRLHSADEFRNRKTRFNVAAYRVKDNKQPFDLTALLNRNKLRNDMLVFCGFILCGEDIVSLDLTDHGQAMDQMSVFGNGDGTGLHDLADRRRFLRIMRVLVPLRFRRRRKRSHHGLK